MPASNTSRKGRYNGCDDLEGLSGRGVGRLLAGDDIELDPSEGDLTESDVTISALPPDWDDITNKPTIPTINKITAGDKITLDPADGDLTKGDVKITATVDSAGTINKIIAGPRITLDPADGDLTKANVTITATGNTAGVDVIYDPIFVDLEPENSWWTPTAQFDFMGSTEIQEPDNVYKYILKDIDKSEVFPIKMPADTNGAFIEINFRISHSPSAIFSKKHPAYQLDCPAETFIRAKNILKLGNAEFVSGNKNDFHANAGLKTCCKLSPSTIQPGVSDVGGRESKMNFCTFTAGAEITLSSTIAVMQMHYSDFGMGLGRVKVIPVKISDLEKAKEWIIPQIDDYNNGDIYANRVSNRNSGGDGQTHENGTYYFQETDAARICGNDLRQAVDQLNSAIDFKLAVGDGDAAAIQQLRTDLYTKVLQGAGTYDAVRTELTALKETAKNLGVIGLTKFEQDAGVVWDKPGLPVA